jgi:hypothetical protein
MKALCKVRISELPDLDTTYSTNLSIIHAYQIRAPTQDPSKLNKERKKN